MIEDWIDTLVEVWKIDAPGFRTCKSPYLIREKKFPATISPKDDFPIALTIPASLRPKYSQGNKHMTWYGVTEFHITADLSKDHLPSLLLFPGRILRAAAQHVMLGGLVGNFVIVDQVDGIAGPVQMQWGDEAPHWGFVVKWMVEESLNGTQLPVSA